MSDSTIKHEPMFYTVPEAARVLRVNPSTLYRAIREDAFPAVRVRARYVVPVKAIEALAAGATEIGGLLDVATLVRQRQTERELAQRWK